MRLYEIVNKHHIGTDLTCAEAMFRACSEYYKLDLSEESRRLFSLMGIGMQTECSVCGAFTVAVGIIGFLTSSNGEGNINNAKGCEMVEELTDRVLNAYATLVCNDLQMKRIEGFENPCHAIVQQIAIELEDLIDKYGVRPIHKCARKGLE